MTNPSLSNSSSLYPSNWPSNPFHQGEVKIQKRFGVHQDIMSYAPRFIRPFMPDQHRSFFTSQPFLVVAARDNSGKMWATLLFRSYDDSSSMTDFVTSADPTRLTIRSKLLPGDALQGSLNPGSDLGILGIEFKTRHRNRVNGRLINPKDSSKALEFKVDQSFGNCPQYIKPRDWWVESNHSNHNGGECNIAPSTYSKQLSDEQKTKIEKAETIFVATGYRGEGEDPRFGNDASHRGGPAGGFIQVEGFSKLLIPDYQGNNHFNTIGNIEMDSRMGVTVPLFETGGMIQMTGTSTIDWDESRSSDRCPGAKRIIEFSIDSVVEIPTHSFPICWSAQDTDKFQLQVTRKVQQSSDVASFYLEPLPEDSLILPTFQPGQHLPISLDLGGSESVDRTYSLSGNHSIHEYYRISVKREPFGFASTFLHDDVQPGDLLTVQKPAGDFVYDDSSSRTLVLLSSGIGMTPLLPMLYKFVNNLDRNSNEAYWIHSTTNGKHHPFKEETDHLRKLAKGKVKTHITYTKLHDHDHGFDSTSRIGAESIKSIVPDLKNADIYLCGAPAFISDLSGGLESLGVPAAQIHSESFSTT